MKLRPLAYGLSTFIRGVSRLRTRNKGGRDSARYCYSVWLRHLVMAKRNGLNPFPKSVAELGPGDSLGVGLAALISGCEKYSALDIVEHANIERNLAIFDELMTLFRNRTQIPGDDELPEVKPQLEEYRFPSDILDDSRLHKALESSRIENIRNSIKNFGRKDSMIQYKVPWNDGNILQIESMDMIYSQAVLEHIDDLENTYRAMYLWLKSNGFISHTIDFKCHGFADEWNGHWVYSDFMWKLIRGKRPFFLNREPHSTHVAMMQKEGFKIVCDNKTTLDSKITLNQLAARFNSISEDDLVTSATFIQGVKLPARGDGGIFGAVQSSCVGPA